MNTIILSICIPTNGRIEILLNTIDSIYKEGCDNDEFEVIISDNSERADLEELLSQKHNFPNLHYYHTNVSGFMNSINALNMGVGELLKLHNNYTVFQKGSLKKMLEIIREHLDEKPLVFFSNNSLKLKSRVVSYSFNDFLFNLSYFSSWSTGFSIWNIDFKNHCKIDFNQMFPHTSLLFEQIEKDSYIIYDDILFFNQSVPTKGGYNLFKVFCVDFLGMLSKCTEDNKISVITFNHIKRNMFYSFLIPWFYATKVKKNNFTYDLTRIKESIVVYYSGWHYYLMLLVCWCILPIKNSLSKISQLKLKD